MKTILSIDFDGVLHSLDAAYAVNDSRLPVEQMLVAGLFCYNQILEDALRQHDPISLVVHSSWRLACSEERIRELLGPLSHRLRAVTPPQVHDREASILDVLRRWQVPPSRVVLLDDQTFYFRSLRDRLIECPSDAGVPAVLDKLHLALEAASH
jgi:hypothetical protein